MHNRLKIYCLLVLMLCRCMGHVVAAKDGQNIWEGTNCRADVRLVPYPAAGDNNTACIVCPGGSYFWLARKTEGEDVARWLQSNGISAYVLEYRVGGVPAFVTRYRFLARGHRYPDMLQDVQRSIQLLREQASVQGINPGRLGVMGFSAGGHLAVMAGEFFDTDVLSSLGISPNVSLRPDFIVPIYPVVTLSAPVVHKRSRRGLLGEGRAITQEMKDSLSLEKHVRPDMPPAFLMNCVDDPIVDYRNSELLDSAMTAMGIRHAYIRYQTGGHGFGTNPDKTTHEAIQWKGAFLKWIKTLFP
ncbi:MAG: alpha/beta hydrolase [Paraprevotella sp.]|nr:alpha/beta hydrolase [Paraprevotella sp.]